MVATDIAENRAVTDYADGVPAMKPLRRAYGFEEVAIVPGRVTLNPRTD